MRKIPLVLLCLTVLAGPALAGGKCKGKEAKKSFEDKFMQKMHFIWENQDELEVSKDQLMKLMELKVATKKDLVQQNADIQILTIDAEVMLYADKIDTKSLDALVEKKYGIKADKARLLVAATAKVKDILSQKQKDKMMEIWKEQSKMKSKCSKCAHK